MRRTRTGFTRIDVLAAACCTVVLGTMAAAVTGGGHGDRTMKATLRDATHLKEIHHAMLIFAQEFEGLMPRPGLIDRHPVEFAGEMRELPGRGAEDASVNTTAALYAALIMQNYMAPPVVVSPVERNPKVTVDADYDYDKYNPAEDTYWDDGFTTDLAKGSNASYAHLVLFGARVEREWRATGNARFPALGNRGPLGGEPDGRSYTCGPHGHWAGNIVFADNHTELLTAMTVKGLVYEKEGGKQPDNIFAMETGAAGSDAIVSFTKEITDEGPVLQHD